MLLGRKSINGVCYVVSVSPVERTLDGIYRQEIDGRMISVMAWIKEVKSVYNQLVSFAKELAN